MRQDVLLLSLRECNASDWYRHPEDHRCPHDAWVENVAISEPAFGARSEQRMVQIRIQLLGAYQDGTIEFTYHGVHHHSLHALGPSGHGDWLSDEVLDRGRSLVHNVVLTKGRFEIEAKEVEYRWTAFPANRLL